MTKKELEEIGDNLSDRFEDNYFPTVMSPGFTVAPYVNRYVLGECFINGFDACADLLLPIIEKNKKTIETISGLLNNKNCAGSHVEWSEYEKEKTRALSYKDLSKKQKQIIKDYEEALEWLLAGFTGMWGSQKETWYEDAINTAPDKITEVLKKHKGE